jgi:hypothetical protein
MPFSPALYSVILEAEESHPQQKSAAMQICWMRSGAWLQVSDHADTLEHGGRVLRVVYNGSVKPVRVVTAFFDRTQRNKL